MINIAILGYGVVGSGVAEVCRMNGDYVYAKTGKRLNLNRILDIRDFPGDAFEDLITKKPEDVFDDPDISIIVETIGGTGIAYEFTKRALLSGKSVVTSNKELVSTYGPELLDLAASLKLSYMFEASVGGGIPIVRPLNKCLSGNRVLEISGILNGTTNYILSGMMNNGVSFETALREAQDLGYAEQNPVADIEGIDSSRKLAILSSIVTGEYIDYRYIYTEGISKVKATDMLYAKELGYKIKLIARIQRLSTNNPFAIVAPMFLPLSNPLAVADDVFNAILVEGNALGESMFYGKGAGKLPTASAIIADIIEVSLHINLTPHRVRWNRSGTVKILEHTQCPVCAFIRIPDNETSKAIISKLATITDLQIVKSLEYGEIALIAGKNSNLNEQDIFNVGLSDDNMISFIRLFTK